MARDSPRSPLIGGGAYSTGKTLQRTGYTLEGEQTRKKGVTHWKDTAPGKPAGVAPSKLHRVPQRGSSNPLRRYVATTILCYAAIGPCRD